MSGTANTAPPERGQVLTTEEAALRHVAMLVARGAPTSEIFHAAAEQVGRIFGRPWVGVMQYDSAASAVMVATWGEHPFPVGSRWPLDGPSTLEAVLRTGRPAAIPDYTGLAGTVARAARQAGIVGGIGAPIVVDGSTWGVMAVPATRGAPIPAGVETRLSVFTELVAAAISNAEARTALALLVDEQAALRRVATLVARESSPVEIFGAVTDEACRVLESEAVGLLRFEPDGTATLVAQSDTPWDPPPLGTRFTLDGENVVTQVFRTGEVARVDDWSGSTGAVAAMADVLGVRSAVASPVVVEGALWGTIVAATSRSTPLPPDTEFRIREFTELVATSVANAEARSQLSRLADEQAALRRVATLVAAQAAPDDIHAAVAEEVALLLAAHRCAVGRYEPDETLTVTGYWSMDGTDLPVGTQISLEGDVVTATVRQSGRPIRIDTFDDLSGPLVDYAREVGPLPPSTVGAPIVVDGQAWGIIFVSSMTDPLPGNAESRVVLFTELVATAIVNADSRSALRELAEEQAALRRVATLVAKESALPDVLAGVAEEFANVLGDVEWALARDDGDGMATALAVSAHNPTPAGTRVPIDAGSAFGRAIKEERPARIDDYFATAGDIARIAREHGIRAAVSCPIVVRGRTWGAMSVGWRNPNPFPPETETVVARFSDLVATAIANAEARAQVERLADEQAALRRIATLVAGGAVPEQVFAAVTEEIAATFDAITAVMRFEHDPPGNVMVGLSEEGGVPIGTRWPLGEGMLSTEVYRTGRSTRIGALEAAQHGRVPVAGFRFGVPSQVACPIVVEGSLWGVITLNAERELPPDTEQRLEKFIELVTTAIANAQAGIALRAAAEEQGALKRVATLVAASAAPTEVFAAVTEEIALVLGADVSLLCRADPDGAAVVVGRWGDTTPQLDTRIPRGGRNLATIVLDTGRPARIESNLEATGDASEIARSHGLRSAVGAPILVEGRQWGLVIAGMNGDEPLPSNAEERLAGFSELVATAISNATARAELVASRARIVTAGDEARRRIERNLHDGTQQRLLALGLDLQRARATIPDDQPETQSALVEAEQDLEGILEDLRELSHGLHPQLLSRLGLGPSLNALARRSPIPVHLDVDVTERPAASLETALYYVVSEALTNAIKHSNASEISVTITSGEKLKASIVDDGVGNADPSGGSGLTGLLDRVDALGGRFALHSPPGGGTSISIELPAEPTLAP